MTKKSSKIIEKRFLKRVSPYLLTSILILNIAFFGSLDKTAIPSGNMNMESIANNNYSVSADQISEFYIVSELASAMRLPTAEAVNINYNSLTVMRDIGQIASTERLEKPEIIDTSHLSRGIRSHKVIDGDSLASIAAKYNITETQVRWSNNLKNNTLSIGQTLYLPSVAGIVYRVKAGDTVESLARKYKSDVENIITVNDLEVARNLTPGTAIILPSGELPETERPEYVRPRPAPVPSAHSNSYVILTYRPGGSNPMPWGWCTWYTWQRRSQMGAGYVLPWGGLGNANTWDNSLSGRFRMNYTPAPGAIFQTDSGYYGHVGIVDAVHDDGTITISDMNGIAGWGRVGSQRVGRNVWGRYKFIHERIN